MAGMASGEGGWDGMIGRKGKWGRVSGGGW